MAPEGIARIPGRRIAGGYPRPALDQVIPNLEWLPIKVGLNVAFVNMT